MNAIPIGCTNGRRYQSARHAAQRLGLRPSNISAAIRTGYQLFGLRFGYVDQATDAVVYQAPKERALRSGDTRRVATREELDRHIADQRVICQQSAHAFSRRFRDRKTAFDDAMQDAAIGIIMASSRATALRTRHAPSYFRRYVYGQIRSGHFRLYPEIVRASRRGVPFNIIPVGTMQGSDRDDELTIESMAVVTDSPSASAARREMLEHLRASLRDVCTVEERQMLADRFARNLLPAEIADRFGMTEEDVHGQLASVLSKLKQNLAPIFGGDE